MVCEFYLNKTPNDLNRENAHTPDTAHEAPHDPLRTLFFLTSCLTTHHIPELWSVYRASQNLPHSLPPAHCFYCLNALARPPPFGQSLTHPSNLSWNSSPFIKLPKPQPVNGSSPQPSQYLTHVSPAMSSTPPPFHRNALTDSRLGLIIWCQYLALSRHSVNISEWMKYWQREGARETNHLIVRLLDVISKVRKRPLKASKI